jgi:hypothetical protein
MGFGVSVGRWGLDDKDSLYVVLCYLSPKIKGPVSMLPIRKINVFFLGGGVV